MRLKFFDLIRQDIGVGYYVIDPTSSELFLHFRNVIAKAVFSSDFIAVGEMVDSLVLVKTFIEVGFARGRGPKDVPVMRISVFELIGFK